VTYDTIIIGAGLSGLAAGIRLAYFGRKVCVLERHTTIGGLNSFYRLRHRNYDVGLHAVTNFAPKGTRTGPLSKLLRQLRLSWDDFSLCPQRESTVVFPGVTLRFNNDFRLLEQQVAENFPGQKDNFRWLVKRIREHDEVSFQRKNFSARAVVGNAISDPLLVDMLFCPLMFYGSPTPHDMDFSQFVIMFKSIFFEGFARPFEGVRLIMRNVIRQFREFGGELKLRHGVKGLKLDAGRATGVILDDGRELDGTNILSSAGSHETMRMCGNGQAAKHPPGEISFCETIHTLDRQPAELGHRETIVFYNRTPRFRYARPETPVDVDSGIICSPNNFQYDQPLPEGTVRITSLADPGYWLGLEDDEAYRRAKDDAGRRMLDSALSVMPDFRPHVIDSDMFTPKTIRRFTGHTNGCVYGAPQKVLDGRTHLDNLYLCGTDQGYLGIIGSMLSGISIANAYLLK
jgi:phytoene dehydrogenase-like protein